MSWAVHRNHSNFMWYKNVKAQNLLILAFSLVGIVCSVYFFNLKSDLSLEEKRQIETTVLSTLVDYLTHHPQVDTDYFFIGISGSDPSPKILNVFNNHKPAVEPISSSKMTYGFTAPVVHKSDLTKRGITIDLEILDKEPNGTVKVLTSLYQDRASSARYEFTLDKFDGVYRIISSKYPDRSTF